MNNKYRNFSVLLVIAIILLVLSALSSCKGKKVVYDEGIFSEVKDTFIKIDEAETAAERKELFILAENTHKKTSASQSTYNDDDKAIALAFYKYTNQKEVEDISEETFKSLSVGISYDEALKLVGVYRKEFEVLLKNKKNK